MRLIKKDEILAKEGDIDKKIFILIKGVVGIFKGDIEITRFMEKGTIIGEMSMLLKSPRTASIKTLTDSYIEEIEGDVEKLISMFPEITKNIMVNLAERLMKTTEGYGIIAEKLKKFNDYKKNINPSLREEKMKTFTDYIWFKTADNFEMINITKSVENILSISDIKEGLIHITIADKNSALVIINEVDENLEQINSKLKNYNQTNKFESNYFLNNNLTLSVTKGKIELGIDSSIFYVELLGRKRKKVVIKIIGI